ncbi:hypothetical protein SKAU_G00257420 [Synaphobranchus kaupii]|uniref:Uncharacterized protein n=1 Tax=Synaphobranchus kaupii TaxID=118154 RepID=A0A9Q1F4F6_SYNKA|nr:hypothetical protein SKAU_G00257420 [Synaphobranchus kaupii]
MSRSGDRAVASVRRRLRDVPLLRLLAVSPSPRLPPLLLREPVSTCVLSGRNCRKTRQEKGAVDVGFRAVRLSDGLSSLVPPRKQRKRLVRALSRIGQLPAAAVQNTDPGSAQLHAQLLRCKA